MSFTDEKIIETKQCTKCSESFDITDKDLEFYDKVSPVFGANGGGEKGNKVSIPKPNLCPPCRVQRRLSWANQMTFYNRVCDLSGKKILSNVSPDKNYKIYEINEWYGDKWDQLKSGIDFDFDIPFFQQFGSLLSIAPIPNLQRSPGYDENAEYTNYAGKNKDCYFIFDSDKNRNTYFSYSVNSSEYIVDSFRVGSSRECYELIDCVDCYNSKFLQNCNTCSFSLFLKDCANCEYCFGSVNLVNQKYYFYNTALSKEEYFKKLESIGINNNTSIEKEKNILNKNSILYPNKFIHGVQNEEVIGDYIVNSKSSYHCYDSRNLRDCKYIQQSFDDAKNCFDCSEIGDEVELLYETCYAGIKTFKNVFCSHMLGESSYLIYCFFTPFCSNCLGCVGLHHKQYCIFNKQYTKQEYEELAPKILHHMKQTGEWGEFFPSILSPFGYNETHAFEYFPLEKNDALDSGFYWSDYETPFPKVDKVIPASKLPESISDIPDDILNWAIECEITKKLFRIVSQELEFYRKHNLPIPRRHPDQRHLDRMKLRNPRKLFKRDCDKCGVEMQTTYGPQREEMVYCEECYNKEVY